MKTKMIAACVAAVFAMSGGVAFATPGNQGGGNGGCGVGQTTNGCSPEGGAGGAGGSGVGVGVGVGIGLGGSANATGGNAVASGGQGGAGGAGGQGGFGGNANSTNLNGNLNANRNQNNNRNSNRNNNTNNNANSNTNRNNLANSQGQGQDQGQLQGQLQGQVATGGKGGSAVSGGNTLQGTQANGQSVNVEGDTVNYRAQDRNPVNTAYAPNIAPTATCMGSTSAGAQGIGFGISVGSTWTAAECQTLEQGRFAAQVLGQTDVAAEIACSLDKYREARKRVGKPCDVDKATTTAAKQPEATVAPVASVEQQPTTNKVASADVRPIGTLPSKLYIN